MGQQAQALRARRGMSVVEMLIACAVVVLLGVMTVNFLFPAMALSAQGSLRAEMQQQGSIAMIRIVDDLESTAIGGLSILGPSPGNPNGYGVVRLMSASDTSQVWDDKVTCVFYHPAQKKLIRKEYPPAPPALSLPFNSIRPLRVPPADLLAIANQSNATEKTLAVNVEAFSVDMPGRSPVEVKLTLQKTVPHSQKLETLSLQRSVSVRNDS